MSGMEVNLQLKKMRISRQPSIIEVIVDKKTTGKCGIFQLSG